MLTTINISLPTSMYKAAKELVKKRGYSSMSELIRDALREAIFPVTENGFTPEFEERVLKAAAEPVSKARAWDGKGSFSDSVLKKTR